MTAAGALANAAVIRASGPDATRFLQSQLTQDVASAGTAATVLAGWADPKGRLQWAGHLWLEPDGSLALLAPRELATEIVSALRRFVLRAKVMLDTDTLMAAGALTGAPDLPGSRLVALAGDPARQLRVAAAGSPSVTATAPDGDAWELADIRAGLPTVFAATRGEFVPQMVNLDLLGGISFTKGCYPGQEIVARTRYLGRVKRRMLRFGGNGPPPEPGAAVHGPRGAAGQVVRAAPSATGCELLAVLVLDEWPGPFQLADGRGLAPLPLPYEVPGADAA